MTTFTLIISIIALIISIATYIYITIETTPWGESELIDKISRKLARY